MDRFSTRLAASIIEDRHRDAANRRASNVAAVAARPRSGAASRISVAIVQLASFVERPLRNHPGIR
jgi:hypothetical protein